MGTTATISNLIDQMSRGSSILNQWDAVLNIKEELVNQLFQAQFESSNNENWKKITIAYCQLFPNPVGEGNLAVYSKIDATLAKPSLLFLSNNQAFVKVHFYATGSSGVASKVVASNFDPKKDCNPNDPDLVWKETKLTNTDFICEVPLTAITGSTNANEKRTEFVLDFPAGSFNSPLFLEIKDKNELQLQIKNYLLTNKVSYVINSIKTDLLGQIPQMVPKAFKINVLTTNEGKNIFQIFIATVNPAQNNLTIGVNEPIPDGYGLSVFFNSKIVKQLESSLMIQVWGFMQSNLIFPGETNLQLGPEYKPDDAVVLGNLYINTTKPTIPINPINNKIMLDIQKTKQISIPGQPSFTIYGDDVPNSNAWYITPKVVLSKISGTDIPQFSLVKYNSNGGKISGFCRFSVQLMIDPTQKDVVKKEIPNAEFPQFDWIQSGATFTYTIDGKTTSIVSEPSNFGSQQAVFSVPLIDEKAIAAFTNAFYSGSGGGLFSISYDLSANTRLPAVTVVTKFDSTLAYQYQQENRYKTETRYSRDTWGHTHSQQVQVYIGTFVKEMLTQTQAATVVVTPGVGLTPTLLDMVKTWANQQLQNDVEQSINMAMNLMKNPSNDFSLQNVSSFTNTLTTSNVVPWYFEVEGSLPPFDSETWKKVYSEVNQQELDVTFNIQEDLSAHGIDRVNLTFQYGDVPSVTHTFSTADQSLWSINKPGQFNGDTFKKDYKYKYDVIYSTSKETGKTPQPLSTDWITSELNIVNISLVDLGLMAVTFAASNIDWEDSNNSDNTVKEITVDWNWLVGTGEAILNETLILNKKNDTVTSTLRSVHPANNQVYQYSLTFLMSDGTKLYSKGINGTSSLQRINHPLSEINVSVLPLFSDDVKAVVLRATFDDNENNIHLSQQWKAISKPDKQGNYTLDTSSFNTWDFKAIVKNLNMATIVFSGTWVNGKNVQKAIPKTLIIGTNNTLLISDTQKTVTAVIDASNVNFIDPKKDGVYRVVAQVGNTILGDAKAPGNLLDNSKTITFIKNYSAVQYYAAENIDIDAVPEFHFQYTFTENINNAANTKVTDYWPTIQSTIKTDLPVIPGTPTTSGIQKRPRIVDENTGIDARTKALFERHEAFSKSCEMALEDIS
ncbi:hypothetical protein [Flavobacterium cerinum]|uniref:Uncharacterized protein n=1 Tax=Flavobacterium cerinum TaxID=2502784 RepID=A0A3S3S701_9FLAO|nr:hypothetical protein [Flavobacterium cerinum]RWW91706.1 hypothetical protein EPI11_18220 [Flavobacterium cerinum]